MIFGNRAYRLGAEAVVEERIAVAAWGASSDDPD